jgi:septum formation protein
MHLTGDLVLASASPRRRRLLERLGLDFTVQPSDVSETLPPDVAPHEQVAALAARKAQDVAPARPDALTLAADTLVAAGDDVLGKPADAEKARAMLRRLADTSHEVHTGLALAHPATDRLTRLTETTRVHFGAWDAALAEDYVGGGAPLDKAGAYGLQDPQAALFVKGIEGDYYNVVGLPLYRLRRALRQSFPDFLATT